MTMTTCKVKKSFTFIKQAFIFVVALIYGRKMEEAKQKNNFR